jgi:hypothetical protein
MREGPRYLRATRAIPANAVAAISSEISTL